MPNGLHPEQLVQEALRRWHLLIIESNIHTPIRRPDDGLVKNHPILPGSIAHSDHALRLPLALLYIPRRTNDAVRQLHASVRCGRGKRSDEGARQDERHGAVSSMFRKIERCPLVAFRCMLIIYVRMELYADRGYVHTTVNFTAPLVVFRSIFVFCAMSLAA